MNVLEKILEEIDREIYKQREICNEVLDTPGYRLYERTMKRAKDIVERHIDDVKDTNVPTNDDWIPVEERLPEEDDGKKYIVTDEHGLVCSEMEYGHPVDRNREVCFYKWDDEYWGCYRPKVIAWQPLPESYKKGE